MNNNQLNLFDTPTPASSPQLLIQNTIATVPQGELFDRNDRVRIVRAGPPLDHLNSRVGEIVSVVPGFASVKVEGIAVAIMLRVEALEKYSEISQYVAIHEEATDQITVGTVVECDRAFIGRSGVVRRVEYLGTVAIAWVDYGKGKPLYPALIEGLSST